MIAALTLASVIPRPASADPTCGEGDEPPISSGTETIDAIGTQRALFIFARFPDGEDIGPGGLSNPECEDCGNTWTAAMGAVRPAFADSLLEDTDPPEMPGSLSHYFYSMSQGRHKLKGFAYPSVVTSDTSIVAFRALGADIKRANRHILEKVAATGFNFAQFDSAGGPGGDGVVDYIFIQWQAIRTKVGETVHGFQTTSVSSLLGQLDVLVVGEGEDQVAITYQSGATLVPARIAFDPDGNCVENSVAFVRHRWMMTSIAAHEYGHDLQSSADITCTHIETESRYGLMTGSMTPPVIMMSSLLRKKLGWIDPAAVVPHPTSFPFETTLTLSADYEDGDDCFAIVETAQTNPQQYFILEARKPNLSGRPYNAPNPIDFPDCCYPMRDVGEGLLIAHVSDPGNCCLVSGHVGGPMFSVEAATGRFSSTTGEPDPVEGITRLERDGHVSCTGETCLNCATGIDSPCPLEGPATGRVGDLFKPMDESGEYFSSVFAPFTNPNTNLYGDGTVFQTRYSGISFFDIRWVPGTDDIEVKVRIDDPIATSPRNADTLWTNMVWEGLVQLTADLVIPRGVKLTIAKGAIVVAAAGSDRRGGGEDEQRVEIIVYGELDVQGTIEAPVRFLSSHSTEFANQEFRDWAPETTGAAPGDWYGARFRLEGCERSGYGYMGAVNPPSVIEHAAIENAEYGVKIEDFVAPSLKSVEFVNITNRRDIYLDRTDVFIPAGYWPSGVCNDETPAFVYAPSSWSLVGGTDVVASTSTPMVDAGFVGVAGKVDLVGNGPVATDGSSAPGDSVYFVPETITPIGLVTAGADWGGFTLSTESSGSNLRYAQIGYAANPLFVSYPNGTSVGHCLIHHFADLGIWFQGSLANGAVLDSSVVFRGLGLHESLGDTGIYVDQADETHILTTLVDLQDRKHDTGGVGIEVRYGKTFCEWTPPDSRLLVIDNCQVLGPSQDVQTGSAYSGIRTNWVCGSLLRDCDITKNYIAGWKFVGLELLQTADIQLTCNRVVLCRSGVDIYRDQEPTGTSLRFRRNQLQAALQSADFFALRSNNNPRTKLGPNWAQIYGLNQLAVNVNDTKCVVEEDATGGNILNAQDNFWFTGSSTLLTNGTEIRNRIQESPADQVDIYGFETTLPPIEPDCNPSPPSLNLQRLQAIVSDDPAPTGATAVELPSRLELGLAFPNPASGGGFSLSLAVPADRTGSYQLEAYDLRGRRLVSTKQDVESGGRFRLSWDGRTGERIKVSAGIYFLRITGPGGFEETRKVTVLR